MPALTPSDVGLVVGPDLVDALPVADHEAAKAVLLLQDAGDHVAARMHLDRSGVLADDLQARVRRHDGSHVVLLHCGLEGLEEQRVELRLRHGRDALVDRVAPRGRRAIRRAAVTDEMLRGGEYAGVLRQRTVALKSVDDRLHLVDEGRVFAEGLVRTAPALVARDADAWREGPGGAGRPGLGCRDHAFLLHERGIARCAHADVVREHGGADEVVVAVHGVLAVDQRDLQVRRLRAPGTRRSCRPTPPACSASASSRRRRAVPERIRRDVGLMREVARARPRHLPDLVGERHARQQVGDALRHGQDSVQIGQPVALITTTGLSSVTSAPVCRELDRDRLRLGGVCSAASGR